MINLTTNRDQFLITLGRYATSNTDEAPADLFHYTDVELDGGNVSRSYLHNEIALTIFRPLDTWLIHIRHHRTHSVVLVAVQFPEFTACFKLTLTDDYQIEPYLNNNVFDALVAALGYYPQLDWYDSVLAESLSSFIHNRVNEESGSHLKHISVPVKKLKRDKQTHVSILFHGSESKHTDKVVLVFNVTNNEGRDDTYSVTIRNQTRTLNYLMGLYKRAVYSKFLAECLDPNNTNGDILGVYLVQHNDAVCVRRPVAINHLGDGAHQMHDAYLEVGRAYQVKSCEESLDNIEYIKVDVPNKPTMVTKTYTRSEFYSDEAETNVPKVEREYALHNFFWYR